MHHLPKLKGKGWRGECNFKNRILKIDTLIFALRKMIMGGKGSGYVPHCNIDLHSRIFLVLYLRNDILVAEPFLQKLRHLFMSREVEN